MIYLCYVRYFRPVRNYTKSFHAFNPKINWHMKNWDFAQGQMAENLQRYNFNLGLCDFTAPPL